MFTLSLQAETMEELGNQLTRISALFGVTPPAQPAVPAATVAPIGADIPPVNTIPAAPAAPAPVVTADVAPAVPATPAVPAAQTAPPSALPTAAVPTYTLESLAAACGTLVDANRAKEVQALIAAYGATKLTEVPQAQYASFAAALRQKGVVI